MGWFDEQIKLRKKKDHDAFDRTFLRIACAVTGNKKTMSVDGPYSFVTSFVYSPSRE